MSSLCGARTYTVNDRTPRRKGRSPLFAASAEPTPSEAPTARPIEITSFGWNYRLPSPPAGHVLDDRWLPNPFHDPNFRDLSGLDAPVQRFLLARQETERWLAAAIELLRPTLRAAQPGNTPVRVTVGCNGGHDRSVGIVEILARRLRSREELDVWVLHQDLHHRAGVRNKPFPWRLIAAEGEGR